MDLDSDSNSAPFYLYDLEFVTWLFLTSVSSSAKCHKNTMSNKLCLAHASYWIKMTKYNY